MVSKIINANERDYKSGDNVQTIYCLSTDTKPTGGDLKNGFPLVEMDTGDIYLYNEATSSWTKF